MRRTGSGRADPVASNDGEQGFWPSYADMMSSFALILFFLMLLSYIQNLVTGNNLQNTQEVLEDTKSQLAITLNQVDEAKDSLNNVELELEKANLVLSEKQEEINNQQALIDQQGKYVIAANEELVEMRGKMQSIAVMRLSILEQIRDSLIKVMGDASKVSIGDNGNIILNEGVLFDLGSSEIKGDSQPVLDQLTQVFTEFLTDGDNAQYVDSIVISGHTDNTGDAESNRMLSTGRANSVLNYILTTGGAKLEPYSQYFCAAGYGLTRPVADNGTEEGRAANRRIEISMILKDDSVMKIVDEYLQMELPGTDTSGISLNTEVKPSDTTSGTVSGASAGTASGTKKK